MPVTKMSEARFNDLVYLTLKKCFFESMFGEGHGPRECDIRICMDMTCKERVTSFASAILSPSEVSPRSHDVFYDVDTDVLLEECLNYMEDHWWKASLEEVFVPSADVPDPRKSLDEFYEGIVEHVLSVPEELCGG